MVSTLHKRKISFPNLTTTSVKVVLIKAASIGNYFFTLINADITAKVCGLNPSQVLLIHTADILPKQGIHPIKTSKSWMRQALPFSIKGILLCWQNKSFIKIQLISIYRICRYIYTLPFDNYIVIHSLAFSLCLAFLPQLHFFHQCHWLAIHRWNNALEISQLPSNIISTFITQESLIISIILVW